MSDTVCIAIFLTSLVVSWGLVFLGFKSQDMENQGKMGYYPSDWVIFLAGFSIMPVANTIFSIITIGYIVQLWDIRRETNASSNERIRHLDSWCAK